MLKWIILEAPLEFADFVADRLCYFYFVRFTSVFSDLNYFKIKSPTIVSNSWLDLYSNSGQRHCQMCVRVCIYDLVFSVFPKYFTLFWKERCLTLIKIINCRMLLKSWKNPCMISMLMSMELLILRVVEAWVNRRRQSDC